jgi:hypothetical protein
MFERGAQRVPGSDHERPRVKRMMVTVMVPLALMVFLLAGMTWLIVR